MERETIIEKARNLPVRVSVPVQPAEDHQIWEGEENGAIFMLTKELLPIQGMPPVYSLSLSGNPQGVKSLIVDFGTTFGKPIMADHLDNNPGVIMCMWNSKEVDERIGK